MLLGEKTELGRDQITVLPETYKKQQAQLTTVLGKLVVPKLSSYKSIFYSLEHDDIATQEEVHA